MRYKAGDKVRIISKERFEKNPQKYRSMPNNFIVAMDYLLGSIADIVEVFDGYYSILNSPHFITDEVIEGLAGAMDSDTIQKDKDKKKLHGELQKYIVTFNLNDIKDLPKEFHVWSLEAKADWLQAYARIDRKPAERKWIFVEKLNHENKTVSWRYADSDGRHTSFSTLHEKHKEGYSINWDAIPKGNIPDEFLGTAVMDILRGELDYCMKELGDDIGFTISYNYTSLPLLERVKIARRNLWEKSQQAKENPEQPKETVNHPAHYGGDTPYEVVKVMEAWDMGYHLGNAIKYIYIAGKKDPSKTKEDLQKAMWYIQRKIAILPVLLCFCLVGFSQTDSSWILKGDTVPRNTADFIFSKSPQSEILFNVNHNNCYEIWDKAGCWLRWKEDSDTLQLIPPAKVHYIMIGKKVIRL